MWDFISWMVIGLVAGLLARALMPGDQPMGWILTMILGMVGSLVGGFLSSQIFGYRIGDPDVHAGGLFIATGGAMLVLIIYSMMTRGNRRLDSRV